MPTTFSIPQKIAAWSVHIFTASGLVAGFMAILAVHEHDFRMAAIWLIVCQIVDGIDGTFARMAKVKEVLPNMNGSTIDYVIDFATYAIIPAFFFYEAALAPANILLLITSIILVVSALYYGKEGMVSEDYYFIGFPVMWNIVVFFLFFIFQLPPWGNVAIILFFAILHFVPIKFVYPSRATRFQGLTIAMTVMILASLGAAIWFYPERSMLYTWGAIISCSYFGIMAIWDTWFS